MTRRPAFPPPSPLPLALDHTPYRLAAQATAESLVGRTPRGNEQLIAARSGTGRSLRIVGWALTLALPLGGLLAPGLLRLSSLADPLAIAATLLTAALSATIRLPPRLVGTPIPPAIRRILARRTAIPRLGILGLEELLAAFQQAAPPPWPLTGALPTRRSTIMMKLTQGSANSRKVKPRRGLPLLSGTPCIRCLILRPPSLPG